MKIGICDDEKEIRELLMEKVGKLFPDADILLYASGEEVLAGVLPDILLLDIQMRGISGMDTAAKLRLRDEKIILIFISVLSDYVFQAFDVGAFHYLVKPFSEDKLSQVLRKAVKQYQDRQRCRTAGELPEREKLLITAGGQHITVDVEEIVYAEVFDRKVILHMMDADIEYYGKLKELEKRAGENFFRTHRAYLVNLAYVQRYDAKAVYLEKGRALMAKQNYREFVKRYLRYNQRRGRE